MIKQFLKAVNISISLLILFFILGLFGFQLVSPQTFSLSGLAVFITVAYCEVLFGI